MSVDNFRKISWSKVWLCNSRNTLSAEVSNALDASAEGVHSVEQRLRDLARVEGYSNFDNLFQSGLSHDEIVAEIEKYENTTMVGVDDIEDEDTLRDWCVAFDILYGVGICDTFGMLRDLYGDGHFVELRKDISEALGYMEV